MGAKIFVGNLNPRTTKSELAGFFSTAGKITSISLAVDRETGEPRGFCFVEFADREAAENAFTVCAGHELNGHRLRLGWAHAEGAIRGRRHIGERPDWDGSFDGENASGREPAESWRGSSRGDDYSGQHRSKHRRHGKHGSDRKRRSGTRRVIE